MAASRPKPLVLRCRCTFEDSASSEMLVRLDAYPKLREALQMLPPKLLLLSSTGPPTPIAPSAGQLGGRVERIVGRIKTATFRSDGEKEIVAGLYTGYVSRLASTLQTTLGAFASQQAPGFDASTLPVMPSIACPSAPPLRLAEGQLVLLEGRLGVLTEDGGGAVLPFAGGQRQITFDGCDQAVLPWRSAEVRAGLSASAASNC